VAGCAVTCSTPGLKMAPAQGKPLGSFQTELPFFKDVLDYRLTGFPGLYLFVERFRGWINWDKRVYLSFVQRGDVVLDIGANIGTHALFFSHLVRAQGRVLAFEPLGPNIDALRETMRRRSRVSNVRVFQTAVGNPRKARQDVVIRAPGEDLTQASLRFQGAGSWEGETNVREYAVSLTSLDADGDVQALSSIDFIKIDVEGGELDVWKGGAQTIRRHKPLVYCEVYEKWATSFDYTPGELFVFAKSLGYTGGRAISKGAVHALSLDENPPRGLFETSSDVLFFTDKHRPLVDAFDKRYLR
jgi:FkbM family methyltransferase